jgi:hypothetical protein
LKAGHVPAIKTRGEVLKFNIKVQKKKVNKGKKHVAHSLVMCQVEEMNAKRICSYIFERLQF